MINLAYLLGDSTYAKKKGNNTFSGTNTFTKNIIMSGDGANIIFTNVDPDNTGTIRTSDQTTPEQYAQSILIAGGVGGPDAGTEDSTGAEGGYIEIRGGNGGTGGYVYMAKPRNYGKNYQIGDLISIDGGDGSATFTVTGTTGPGYVSTISDLITTGAGYESDTVGTVKTTNHTGSGTGLTVYYSVVQGIGGGVDIKSGISNYGYDDQSSIRLSSGDEDMDGGNIQMLSGSAHAVSNGEGGGFEMAAGKGGDYGGYGGWFTMRAGDGYQTGDDSGKRYGTGGECQLIAGGGQGTGCTGGDIQLIAGNGAVGATKGYIKMKRGTDSAIKYAKLDTDSIVDTDKTFTFPNNSGTFVIDSANNTFSGTNIFSNGLTVSSGTMRLNGDIVFDDDSVPTERYIKVDDQTTNDTDGNYLYFVAGKGKGSGYGGDLNLQAGSAGTSGSNVGGYVYLNAGNASNGDGGRVDIKAGQCLIGGQGNGGDVTIAAGVGYGTSHRAGNIQLSAFTAEGTPGYVDIHSGGGGNARFKTTDFANTTNYYTFPNTNGTFVVNNYNNAFSGTNTFASTTYFGTANAVSIDNQGYYKATGSGIFWDDVMVNIANVRLPASGAPTWTDYKSSQVLAFSPTADDKLYFSCQIPHQYATASNIEFHLHTAYPNGSAGNVLWQFTYTWASINGAFDTIGTALGTVAAPGTADIHMLDEIVPSITGTGKSISSVLLCSLQRTGSGTADTYPSNVYLTSLDFHIPKDTLGSREEKAK